MLWSTAPAIQPEFWIMSIVRDAAVAHAARTSSDVSRRAGRQPRRKSFRMKPAWGFGRDAASTGAGFAAARRLVRVAISIQLRLMRDAKPLISLRGSKTGG